MSHPNLFRIAGTYLDYHSKSTFINQSSGDNRLEGESETGTKCGEEQIADPAGLESDKVQAPHQQQTAKRQHETKHQKDEPQNSECGGMKAKYGSK